MVFSLLGTILILGGALYLYHRWQTSKLHGGLGGGPGRGIRFALPNRRAKYESQMVRLDGVPDTTFNHDDFEVQFSNPSFNHDNEEGHIYTDFTGSREVAIDVDPAMDEAYHKKLATLNSINENQDGLKNIRIIISEGIKTDLIQKKFTSEKQEKPLQQQIHKSNTDTQPGINKVQNLYRANNYEDLNAQTNDDDELNFDYFNEFKNKSNENEPEPQVKNVDLFDEFLSSENAEVSFKAEDENELKDIFSNDIEENLPELFGAYKQNATLNIENEEINLTKINSSPILRITAPLGFSLNNKMRDETDNGDISSQSSETTNQKDSFKNSSSDDNQSLSIGSVDNDDDYTPIDKNAFKNFRIESNNNFVLDDSKSNLKELIKNKNEKQTISNHETNVNNFEKEIEILFSSGIGNISFFNIDLYSKIRILLIVKSLWQS